MDYGIFIFYWRLWTMIFSYIQINVVVSGALDRLHSEKDPCVKYDVNRKLWIYLHRSRSEEEFGKAKHIVHGFII